MTPPLQTVRDLRLNLVEGPINEWSQFTILQGRSEILGPWGIKAHVIGASHLISIHHQDRQFHEIVACMEVKAAARPLYYGPIPDAGSLTQQFMGQVEYRFDSQILEWEAGEPVMLHLEQRVNLDAERQFGLAVDFSPVGAKNIPKTIILVKMENQVLRLETVHSYPNENCIAFTETSIKETS